MNYLNAFRGISVILVVLGHAFYTANWKPDGLIATTFYNLVDAGTILFVFVAGFMFQSMSLNGYNFKRFMISRCQFVLLPYLILSVIPILARMFILDGSRGIDFVIDEASYFSYFEVFVSYLWYGAHLNGYWFIPVIMLFFLSSPLFVKFSGLGFYKQFLIIILFSLVAVFIQRPLGNVGVFQSFFYYLPIYLSGMFYSANFVKVNGFIDRRRLLLVFLVLIFASIQPLTGSSDYGSKHKIWNEFSGVDLMYMQKLLLSFLLMFFLWNINVKRVWFLNLMAVSSFCVYLIHPWVTVVMNYILGRSQAVDGVGLSLTSTFFDVPLILFAILFITIFIGVITKLIFKSNSKRIIGW